MQLKRTEHGFTLIELLVSIVIIGIIAIPLGNSAIGILKNVDATSAPAGMVPLLGEAKTRRLRETMRDLMAGKRIAGEP